MDRDLPAVPVWSNELPHQRISPAEGFSRFVIMPRSVLLPQPEGPISVRNSPGSTLRSTGSSPLNPLGNVFSAERTSMTGVCRAGAISFSTFLENASFAIRHLNPV